MRIAHLADLHFHRDHYEEAAASIHTVVAEHGRNPFDLIAIAGDIWDGAIMNTLGSMFMQFVDLIRELADCAPVVMIYGTPSHDTEGSLEVFEQIEAEHQIMILMPGRAYALGTTNADIYDLSAEIPHDTLRAILFGVPEPNKKWLLANAGATGKDEADEFARSAMRGLFLGLGGLRKEHANLPCILLYHGQVAGAKSGTGYECASGLMASKDDLAMVGADYVALGDIHMPQRIGDLFAYYPGSIYPINWGETHKAGCNIVEIDNLGPLVSRLDFPHPQRAKVSPIFDDISEIKVPRDRMTWMEITCTREEAVSINTDVVLDYLLDGGCLPGSRVTLNILPTETVRAGEITEKTHLRDKVQVYADNSNVAASEAVLKKADELERDAAATRPAGSGAHLRMDRLILRGAIGIYKKSRKDEIDLDLESYGPGVLALVGGNGAGKTTILENLHPWPTLLTREGTLKDHFRLKDSFRDLYFTDERTLWRYRSLITIRADISSGTTEYNLFRDQGDGRGYEPYGGTNGRKEPYEAAVNELFGSLEMYLRTAMVTQRPTKFAPDLSAATKGERKALFAELSGIDYLEAYRLTAKGKADAIDEQTRELRATIEAASGVDEELAQINASIASAAAIASAAESDALLSIERGKALRAQHDAQAAHVAALNGKAARAETLEAEIRDLLAQVQAAETEIQGFQAAANGKEKAVAELAQAEALAAELSSLRAGKAVLDGCNQLALAAHQNENRAVEAKRREAQARLDEARRKLAKATQDTAVARARLAAPVADHCPTCAQLLPAEKRAHLTEERARLEAQIKSLADLANEAAGEETSASLALSTIVQPPEPVLEEFGAQARLQEVEGSLDWMDVPALRDVVRKADEAAVRIEEAQRRATESRSQAARRRIEVDAINRELTGSLVAETRRLEDLAAALETERQGLTATRERAAGARATILAEERAAASAQARKDARDAATASVSMLAGELSSWRFLERACGPDGIQALELDALAPGIAEVANRLLAASGNTGRIEFRTTRIGGKGSRTKIIEDFLVFFVDSSGEEQEIATLSGGETVWVKKALYSAFGIIRARNQGVRFQTVVMDEADGALDSASRMRYLMMLEAEHKESKRYQTLLVTHSIELQAMVNRVVKVEDL